MPDKIELSIAALASSETQPGHFTLVLEDVQQQRRIPLIIGANEAQAIAMSMEKMQPARPFTHDLLKNTVEALDARLEEVLIFQLQNEVFYARLLLRKSTGEAVELDARPSDAIALAVRFDAPVYSYESVINRAGILIANLETRIKKGSLAEYSLDELEDLLQRLVAKEDYESAKRIKDYLDKRRKH